MSLLESLRVALRALWANPLRGFLTMLGIIFGVGAVITMVAVGSGAQQRVIEQIRSLGANLLLVVPGSSQPGGARLGSGTRSSLTEEDARRIRDEVPFVTASAPTVYGPAHAVRGNQNWATTVQGITEDYLVAREWPVASGRRFSASEQRRADKVALLGLTVAERLFGEAEPIDQVIRINKVPFTVIGVLARKGQTSLGSDQDDKVLIPLRTAKIRVLGSSRKKLRSVHYIMVKVETADLLEQARAQIAGLLRQRHGLRPGDDDDFTVRNLSELQDKREEATGTLKRMLVVVASVSLIVGGISIMNIMLVSVTERTREIGMRLALGARQHDIYVQFLVEAVALSLCGGLIGILLGLVTAMLTAAFGDWPILITPSAILIATGFATAVGVFFGLYPASRAAGLDPIEALRSE